ncbi:MAG: SIS domain-containing protein, partial [Chthonomonadales bacterium]
MANYLSIIREKAAKPFTFVEVAFMPYCLCSSLSHSGPSGIILAMLNERLLARARAVFLAESVAISDLSERIGEPLILAVEMLVRCNGRVITTGIGKAGIIAHKVAATLCSTGTPGLFLHPSEAVHGDLGIVTESDIVMAFSNSGESDEIQRMLPSLSLIGVPIIAVV